MKKILSLSTVFILAVLLVPAAYAVTLQEAKEQGLLGEQRDGYVGLVADIAPPEVVTLMREVNEQRRQRYQQIARQNGITLEQVALVAYERAVAATRSGYYIQDSNGRWIRK